MQIDELSAKVQSLGLSAKQARMVVAGLLLGPAPASKLAEQAAISRPSAYDILAELEEFGLAQQIKQDGATLYAVADYAGLERWMERQRLALAQRGEQLKSLESELAAVTRQEPAQGPRVRYVQGAAGVETILDEAQRKARPGSVVYALTNHDETLKRYPNQIKDNSNRRVNKRIKSRQFYYNSQFEVPSNPKMLKETKRLAVPPRGDITLYEDRAVLLSYEGEWSGLVIEGEAIVETLRQVFELSWDKEKLSK